MVYCELKIQVMQSSNQFIHLKFTRDKMEVWYFTALYASLQDILKNKLWEDLLGIATGMKKPLIAGDFNDIAYLEEKKGWVIASRSRCRRFRDRMASCKVNDLNAKGPKFTWCGPLFHRWKHIYEKLDRALMHDEWNMLFLEAFVKVLVRIEFSDHHPFLINLHEDKVLYKNRLFRFENVWLLNDTYETMLKESWNGENSFLTNLDNVVACIETWKFDTFDRIKRLKHKVMHKLEGIRNKLQVHDNRGGMRKLEAKLQEDLINILNKEELMGHQRSRTLWLADEDRNTRYYQMKTIA